MCYSRCPYESRDGECTLMRGYPADAHCVEDDEILFDDTVEDRKEGHFETNQ
jgi:hypothetical protein